MLARQKWTYTPAPAPEKDYSGYPHWVALLAQPNRELWSASALQRVRVYPYLPTYSKRTRCRGATRFHEIQRPVVSGMMFVPTDLLDIPNRDQIMDWAKVRYAKIPRLLTKAEIEEIRQSEARANERVPENSPTPEIGSRVRFRADLYSAFLGEGAVVAIAGRGRISIEVVCKLLGGKQTFTISSADVEVM